MAHAGESLGISDLTMAALQREAAAAGLNIEADTAELDKEIKAFHAELGKITSTNKAWVLQTMATYGVVRPHTGGREGLKDVDLPKLLAIRKHLGLLTKILADIRGWLTGCITSLPENGIIATVGLVGLHGAYSRDHEQTATGFGGAALLLAHRHICRWRATRIGLRAPVVKQCANLIYLLTNLQSGGPTLGIKKTCCELYMTSILAGIDDLDRYRAMWLMADWLMGLRWPLKLETPLADVKLTAR